MESNCDTSTLSKRESSAVFIVNNLEAVNFGKPIDKGKETLPYSLYFNRYGATKAISEMLVLKLSKEPQKSMTKLDNKEDGKGKMIRTGVLRFGTFWLGVEYKHGSTPNKRTKEGSSTHPYSQNVPFAHLFGASDPLIGYPKNNAHMVLAQKLTDPKTVRFRNYLSRLSASPHKKNRGIQSTGKCLI